MDSPKSKSLIFPVSIVVLSLIGVVVSVSNTIAISELRSAVQRKSNPVIIEAPAMPAPQPRPADPAPAPGNLPAFQGDVSDPAVMRQAILDDLRLKMEIAQRDGDSESLYDLAAQRAALDNGGFEGLARYRREHGTSKIRRGTP